MCEFCSKISLAKFILFFVVLFSFGMVFGVIGYLISRPNPIQPPTPQINRIEISADRKIILGEKLYNEVKVPIFTIADTQKYLKDSSYLYNPDAFQTTNAKYEGDCFIDAALSNNKDKIVFSSGCLPGNLPQPWTGIYTMPPNYNGKILDKVYIKFQFLVGGSGRNFVWSPDDKTIIYEADLGLSGMTEIRTIDSRTGEILEEKNSAEFDILDWQTYRNEKHGFEIKYPDGWTIEDGEIVSLSSDSFLSVIKDDNVEKLSLDDWFEESTVIDGGTTIKAAAKPTYINGIKAYRDESGLTSPNPLFEVSIANSDNEIFTIFAYSDKSADNSVLNNILSTFKFIN